LSDASGEITRTQSFEPFGAPLSSSGTATSEFGFTGEQDDITGLVFLRARFYDPGIGRFITKDPFSGFTSAPASLHPYLYVSNNPVNIVDPSGQSPILVLAAVSFAVGFVANTVLQFQENGGWCGYNPLESLEWGVGFAATSLLVVMTVLSGGSLLGMGLQGLGVLFSNVTLFGAGLSVSGAATAATVWFMTGDRQLFSKFFGTRQSALSPYRRPVQGETYIRYESGHPDFTKVTPEGGLRPGTYAAPASEGILTQTELSIPGGRYNFPNPQIPRSVYYIINPAARGWIIGPKPVPGGTGYEVIFPFGAGPGSVSGPYPVPP
jgi:RHS repeat-associated protein